MSNARSYDRLPNQMRPITLERGFIKTAAGSCLITWGETKVLCTATIQDGVPKWRGLSHDGWISAEYAMLPASGNKRIAREYRGRKGRSMEIERLIGRALRAAVNLSKLSDITITIDCDVLQADGGTRCASITGAWVALHDCIYTAYKQGKIKRIPEIKHVCAVSVGKVQDAILCDLDYTEDSNAQVDMNIVAHSKDEIIEVQGTGEQTPFSVYELNEMVAVGLESIDLLKELQVSILDEDEI